MSPWERHDRYATRDAAMRVSDAERAAVAETLKQHCADGRLDVMEFEERVQRALTARTRADLSGLLHDLPTAGREEPVRPRRRPLALMLVAVVVIGAFTTLTPLAVLHVPWWLLAAVVYLFFRRRRSRDRWSDRGGGRRDPAPWERAA